MPAFTFEKISPPASGPVSSVASVSVASISSVANGSVPSTAKKQRGVIIQILDRFVETRVKRSLLEEKGVINRRSPK
jgi:hypothetical protein